MNQIKPYLIVMGVSGCGKTTLAKRLAEHFEIPFLEGDDFHPIGNINKMKEGIPLTDTDRAPWLDKIHEKMKTHASCVVSCSALKKMYRDRLTESLNSCVFIHLHGSFDLIYNRINSRKEHYMPSSLLQSQFDALEIPENAIHVDVSLSKSEIFNATILKLKQMEKSTIGLLGLGVMGKSLARNIAGNSYTTSVYNIPFEGEEKVVENFVDSFQELPFYGAKDLADFVDSLATPRMILLMIKAGQPVDEMIDQLIPFLSENDMIIDAGNSFYKDTQRREEKMQNLGFHFVGMGVSGGEEGALKGPSIMPAGTAYAKNHLLPILQDISAKVEGEPCTNWVGPDGAGHFVKMIHNGIEYADMQLISELYEICRKVFRLPNSQIANLFESFEEIHRGYLLEISIDILRKKEDDEYVLNTILDVAGHKGTGMWTSREALELGIAVPTITAAMNQRIISSYKSLRNALGASPRVSITLTDDWIQTLEHGFIFSRIQAHIEGFHLIHAASKKNNWNINMSSLSALWRGGCIIRSSMLPLFMKCFDSNEGIEHLYQSEIIMNLMKFNSDHVISINTLAQQHGISAPCFAASIQYFLALTTRELPINMIQAQRDYFGAHTYRTISEPDVPKHTNWK